MRACDALTRQATLPGRAYEAVMERGVVAVTRVTLLKDLLEQRRGPHHSPDTHGNEQGSGIQNEQVDYSKQAGSKAFSQLVVLQGN